MSSRWYAFALVVLGLLLVALPVLAADADVVISEVMFNTTSVNGTDETPYEWVEIYNKGDAAVDIVNWYICDANATTPCDQITAAMCPGGSCSIPANTYWIIANSSVSLTTELANYSAVVDANATIFLGGNVAGNGLSNSADTLYLAKTNDGTQVVDCVSWAGTAGTGCATDKTYVTDGGGSDTALNGEGGGQSITNVQGTWYYSKAAGGTSNQATPYSANEGYDAGGNVTLVDMTGLKVDSSFALLPPALIGGLMIVAGGSLLIVRRRR